ncbi:DUF192 domain-containing protein [Pararobbsia silviterrae]|nr:DUF192 domain-containing protein [Pararobbsia silviterrae]
MTAALLTICRHARRTALLAAVAATLAGAFGASAAAAQPLTPEMPANFKKKGEFPSVTLTVNSIKIAAEVAATQPDREQGLMFRASLGKNEGMLFVFDEIAYHCFWMKNTEIPLSIAYITDNGTITDIQEMAAETEDNHCPTQGGKYAIEMAKGWFTANGIKPGMQMQGLPR